MTCIYCSSKTEVVNSRAQKRNNHVWRRRQCKSCGAVFTSEESPTLSTAVLVRKAKQLKPFNRDLLFLSVYESCKHRKHPVQDASSLTETIITKLLPKIQSAEIDRADIVQTTIKTLQHFDAAASVQYAAFHQL